MIIIEVCISIYVWFYFFFLVMLSFFFPLPLHRSELRNQARDKEMVMYKFIDFVLRGPTHSRISLSF